MNYNYIRNPLTNRNVRVNGQLGRKIIKNYIKEQTGGLEYPPCWKGNKRFPNEISPLYFKALKYTKGIFGKEKPDNLPRRFLIHNKHDAFTPTDPNSLYYRSPQELLELAWTANAHCDDKRFHADVRNKGEEYLKKYYETKNTRINRCEIHKMSFTHIIPFNINDKYEVIFVNTLDQNKSKKLIIDKNIFEREIGPCLVNLRVFDEFPGSDRFYYL